MSHLQPQVVQVAPPRDRYDDKMARARNFCADHSGGAECSSAPPTYESGGVTSYRSGAMPYDQQPSTGWAEAAPRPQPVNVPMAESSASTQGGGFVAPVLSSPAQKDDVRSFVTQPGPEGQEMVQCMLQRRKNHTYELFLRDESRNLEHGQFILATRKTQGKKSATYRVSSSRNDFEKRSPNYLGKIKASELTGAYTLVDTGKNPKKIDAWDKDDRGGASSGARQTLAEIHFSKPSDKRLPDLRNVKLGYNEGTEEQRLQTMPPQVDSHGKLTQARVHCIHLRTHCYTHRAHTCTHICVHTASTLHIHRTAHTPHTQDFNGRVRKIPNPNPNPNPIPNPNPNPGLQRARAEDLGQELHPRGRCPPGQVSLKGLLTP